MGVLGVVCMLLWTQTRVRGRDWGAANETGASILARRFFFWRQQDRVAGSEL